MRVRRYASAAMLCALGACVVACRTEEKAAVRLNVIFPSTELAVASDEVKFTVFDDPEPGACQRIYLKRLTNQTDFPPVVLDPPPSPLCEIALGRSAPLELPVGRHSILAVASRSNADLLVGCSDVALSSDDGEVSITLALPGTTPVPSPLSTCLSVSDFCNGACK